jgi:hypothetical protein
MDGVSLITIKENGLMGLNLVMENIQNYKLINKRKTNLSLIKEIGKMIDLMDLVLSISL